MKNYNLLLVAAAAIAAWPATVSAQNIENPFAWIEGDWAIEYAENYAINNVEMEQVGFMSCDLKASGGVLLCEDFRRFTKLVRSGELIDADFTQQLLDFWTYDGDAQEFTRQSITPQGVDGEFVVRWESPEVLSGLKESEAVGDQPATVTEHRYEIGEAEIVETVSARSADGDLIDEIRVVYRRL